MQDFQMCLITSNAHHGNSVSDGAQNGPIYIENHLQCSALGFYLNSDKQSYYRVSIYLALGGLFFPIAFLYLS